MIRIIAFKEIRALFASPLAWVILALLQFVLAWIFLARMDAFLGMQAQLREIVNPPGATEFVAAPLFSAAAMIFLMVIPLFTMRMIAEERRNQTLPLLFSAPISMSEIILGKFLGLMAFVVSVVSLVVLMSLSLLLGGKLDFGLVFTSVLGLVLLASSFCALGLYVSCLTSQPFLAGIGSIAALLGLWAASSAGSENFFRLISPLPRFESFNAGLMDTSDAVYFLLATGFFLVLAVRRLGKS